MLDFWISCWISGFLSGFLERELNRDMISRPPVGYGAGVLKRGVCELFDRLFQSHCRSNRCEHGSATWYYLMLEDRETLYLDSSLGNTSSTCERGLLLYFPSKLGKTDNTSGNWVPNIGGRGHYYICPVL